VTGIGPPTAFEVADEDQDRRFIGELPGRVRVHTADGLRDEPVLDISDRVITGSERGLLGLAFHPAFADNGRFYVRYSAAATDDVPDGWSHTFVLAEFRMNEAETRADPDSEQRLLEIPQPQGNHNAGDIAFGPDGLLYVTVGDGGGGGDTGTGHVGDWYDAVDGGNGQDVTENLLGSILRIDVDGSDGDRNYAIPENNPLVGKEGLDEHYAWGLRNPWRLSFDGERIFVGDVGQGSWEEVDLVERGGNYGWNVHEGRHCFRADDCPDTTADGEPLIEPIVEYGRGNSGVAGRSITGGYVYRGTDIPALQGRYVFGDLTRSDTFFAATQSTEGWSTGTVSIRESDQPDAGLWSFGTDRDGELYSLWGDRSGNGAIYRLVAPAGSSRTTTVAVDDTPPATEDGGNPGTGAPESTPAASPGFGWLAALGGLTGAVGLARWLRGE
jgi:glucose/arabinose dehydrogenase